MTTYGNKYCKQLQVNERKLQSMCTAVIGTAVKMLALKFQVFVEIMTKHCWCTFSGHILRIAD